MGRGRNGQGNAPADTTDRQECVETRVCSRRPRLVPADRERRLQAMGIPVRAGQASTRTRPRPDPRRNPGRCPNKSCRPPQDAGRRPRPLRGPPAGEIGDDHGARQADDLRAVRNGLHRGTQRELEEPQAPPAMGQHTDAVRRPYLRQAPSRGSRHGLGHEGTAAALDHEDRNG